MKFLFLKSSLHILESLSFTQTLYAFDFDGTLSKIVRIPSEAKMTKTTVGLLQELSNLVPVAIISGRSLSDLKMRVDITSVHLVGNHGLEGINHVGSSLQKAEDDCKSWKSQIERSNFGPGVHLEDKTYSLSIHYRRSRNKKSDKSKILSTVSLLSPLPRVVLGKSVVNLLSAGTPHKGLAIMQILKQSGAKRAFYIGDDDTDEDVFSMSENQIISVRVARKKDSHARYFIRSQSEINKLLRLLIHYHQHRENRNVIGTVHDHI